MVVRCHKTDGTRTSHPVRWIAAVCLVAGLMARTTTKAKKATPTPPATTPEKRTLKPHEVVLSPTIQSAVAIEAWSKFAGTVDLADLVDDLRERIKKVQGGDMQPVEAMLFGQAMTLQTIFTNLARKAQAQEYLKQFQVNLTLALKAQAQCRATLEALAEIKNPRPVAFVKQANISGGPQQVNNGDAAGAAGRISAGGRGSRPSKSAAALTDLSGVGGAGHIGTGQARVSRPVDFIATLPTARPYLQRLLWSRQIEKSYDKVQSSAVVRPAAMDDRKAPQAATRNTAQALSL